MATRRLRPHNPMPESRYEVLALFTAAMIGSSLFVMATGPLLPFFQSAFGLGQTQLGVVLSAQMAGSLVMTAVAGMLTDRFGDKAVVLWSGLLMGVALIAASLVHSFAWVIGWLLVYGIGFAAVTPSGSHAIVYFFKKAERGVAMGIRQCGIPLAGMIGSILLPAIAARTNYQWALAVAGIATIAACATASLLYREPVELEGESGVSVRGMLEEMVAMARDVRLVLLTLASMALVCAQFMVMAFLTLTLVHEAGLPLSVAIGVFVLSQAAAIAGRVFWGWSSDPLFGGSRALPLAAVAVAVAGLSLAFAAIAPSTAVWLIALLAAALGFCAEGWFGVAVLGFAEIGGEEHCGSALGVALTWVFVAAFAAPTLLGAVAEVHGYAFAWRGIALLEAVAIVPAVLAADFMRRFAAAARTS
ncbi:MAG: MFS transporter [Candidatus Eremiobacteraeota bacterium]|nr:MFS transporter [Candidatus Eremiobacteraeota bacterium]MBV8284337.1 MFS transporter [Candidatus Eremiobacteraeota bacterium]